MGSGILVLGGRGHFCAQFRRESNPNDCKKMDAVAAVGARPAAMRSFVGLLWPLVTVITPHRRA